MNADAEIEQFLAAIRAQGRSSPSGSAWHEFCVWLQEAAPPGSGKPPAPFILAASEESDASKHRRLAEPLRWATMHGLALDAIRALEAIPAEKWNCS